MTVSFDVFTGAFLSKITEFEFAQLADEVREDMVDGYLFRAISEFEDKSSADIMDAFNEDSRTFEVEVTTRQLRRLVNMISEGMVVQWLKPYYYKQELLENALNTNDYSTYSPAELLNRVKAAYEKAQRDFEQMALNYSYMFGDLSSLHLHG